LSILSKVRLRELAEKHDGWFVSIFLPTHSAGAEIEQDRIRLKNLVAEAETDLRALGVRTLDIDEMLKPAQKLFQNTHFWQHQSDGLAIFRSRQLFREFRLPYGFQPLMVVAERFHIKPLLPLLSGDGRFYVLALSQQEVRLLQGTRYSVGEVDVEGAPHGRAEALRFNDPERQLQFHTSTVTPGGRGDRPAAFHGQGVGQGAEAKTDILRYFHKVDEGLQEVLRDEEAPLVLAGVDYLLPIYKQANSYSRLVGEGIEGNPQELSAQQLHQRAWRIVQPIFIQALKDATAKYDALASAGSEQASSDVEEVVPAAYHGRVEILFVTVGSQRWGTFDSGTSSVHVRGEREPGDQDLLDLAAVHTLFNGGTIYAVKPEAVPAGAPLAAVFRY
jgi:hypothetical protein